MKAHATRNVVGATAVAAALLLAALAASLGGCKKEPVATEAVLTQQAEVMRASIRDAVADPARREQMFALADRLERESLAAHAAYADAARRLEGLYADYDAPTPEFAKLAAEVRATRDRHRDALIGIHLEMARVAAPGEWSRLIKAELKALETVRTLDEAKK